MQLAWAGHDNAARPVVARALNKQRPEKTYIMTVEKARQGKELYHASFLSAGPQGTYIHALLSANADAPCYPTTACCPLIAYNGWKEDRSG